VACPDTGKDKVDIGIAKNRIACSAANLGLDVGFNFIQILEYLIAHIDNYLALFGGAFGGVVAAGTEKHQRYNTETENKFIHDDSFLV